MKGNLCKLYEDLNNVFAHGDSNESTLNAVIIVEINLSQNPSRSLVKSISNFILLTSWSTQTSFMTNKDENANILVIRRVLPCLFRRTSWILRIRKYEGNIY